MSSKTVKKADELYTDWVDPADPIGSLRRRLEPMADPGFREFVVQALPRCSCPVLGLRTSAWRGVVREILAVDGAAFLDAIFPPERNRRKRRELPALEYCEERIVVAEVIGKVKVEFGRRLDWIAAFMPLIDSWLICDSFCSALKPRPNEKDDLWFFLNACLASDEPYSIRFAFVTLLKRYVDQNHIEEILERVEEIAKRKAGKRKIDVRCVNFGVAWLLTEAFVKFPDATWRYLRDNSLDDLTFHQTLQKIRDSFRVDDETKEEIRAMRRRKR